MKSRGIGVGCISGIGANIRNVCHCIREIESTISLLIPIMFTAFDSKSKLRNYNTFCRASAITLQDLEDFELSICTTVMLSVLDCIRIERNCSDQRKQAKAIGINYKELISVATHI